MFADKNDFPHPFDGDIELACRDLLQLIWKGFRELTPRKSQGFSIAAGWAFVGEKKTPTSTSA